MGDGQIQGSATTTAHGYFLSRGVEFSLPQGSFFDQ